MDARDYPNQFNPKGDFESQMAHEINREIYNLAAGRTLGSEPHWDPPNRAEILAQKDKVKGKIERFVSEKSDGKKIWGWKNPKTSLTIDLYLPYLPNPHFIILFRNPLNVADSTVRMTGNGVSHQKALKLQNFYNREIFHFLERQPRLPRLMIAFEDLVHAPVQEAKRFADFLGLRVSPEMIQKIKKLYVPRQSHQESRWHGTPIRFQQADVAVTGTDQDHQNALREKDKIVTSKEREIEELNAALRNYGQQFLDVSSSMQKMKRILPALEKMIELCRNEDGISSQALVNIGELCFELDLHDSARAFYEKAFIKNPETKKPCLRGSGVPVPVFAPERGVKTK